MGGGILLAVSSVIPSRLVCAATDVELIIVQIMLQKPIYLCCVYLPPPPNSGSVLTVFRYLSSFVHGDCPLILLGDYNLPDIDWCSLSASSIPSPMLIVAVELCTTCKLFYTCWRKHTGSSNQQLL